MLALPHSMDEVDYLVNPEEDYWTNLYPRMVEQEEGFTFVLDDFESWRTTFGNFWYFVAIEKETKWPVSCVMLALDEASVNGKEPLYSMGFYYTDPEWRDTGVGSRLISMLLATAGENNIATTSGLPMVSRYIARMNIDYLSPYIVYRAEIFLKDLVSPLQQEYKQKGLVAKKLHEVNWKDVVDYDVSIGTRNREKYLRRLLQPSDHVFSRIIVDDNNKIVGMGTVRAEVGGCLAVGPLYAESKEAARLIMDSVIPEIDKTHYSFMHFVYPNCNSDAERLVRELSGGKLVIYPYLQPQFTKKIIHIADDKIYSVTDVALSYF